MSLLRLERTPSEPTLGQTAPLLVLLHGRAAYAKTIMSIEGLLDPRFHIVAFQAPYPSVKGGFEWAKQPTDEPNRDPHRYDESEELLTNDLTEYLAALPSPPSSLLMWGFSQGAGMTLILTLRGKFPIVAAVPMSGFLPPVESWGEWAAATHFLVPHGDNDEVLPTESSKHVVTFLKAHGISAEYHEYHGRHKMSLESINVVNRWLCSEAKLS